MTSTLMIVAFIDFRKAFNTLDHAILLNKLAELNFTEKALSWFDSNLTDPLQVTLLKGVKSSEMPVLTGKGPSGVHFGPPALYHIYT